MESHLPRFHPADEHAFRARCHRAAILTNGMTGIPISIHHHRRAIASSTASYEIYLPIKSIPDPSPIIIPLRSITILFPFADKNPFNYSWRWPRPIEAAAIRFQVAINRRTQKPDANPPQPEREKNKKKEGKLLFGWITMIRFGWRFSNAISKPKHNFTRSQSLTNSNGRTAYSQDI